MSEVDLTEAERKALWQARVKCTGHDTMHTLVAAVERIVDARLTAADRDDGLRVIAVIEADRDAEVARLGGWEQVHASGMLNNWIGGFTAAITTARSTHDSEEWRV